MDQKVESTFTEGEHCYLVRVERLGIRLSEVWHIKFNGFKWLCEVRQVQKFDGLENCFLREPLRGHG